MGAGEGFVGCVEPEYTIGPCCQLDSQCPGRAAELEDVTKVRPGQNGHHEGSLALFVPARVEPPRVVVTRVEVLEEGGCEAFGPAAPRRGNHEHLDIAFEVRAHAFMDECLVAGRRRERAHLRRVRRDRAAFRRVRGPPERQHGPGFGRDTGVGRVRPMPEPDRISQSPMAEFGGKLLGDLSENAVIAMPISAPGRDDQGAQRVFRRLLEDRGTNLSCQTLRALPELAVRQAEKAEGASGSEQVDGPREFDAALARKSLPRPRRRIRMRSVAIRRDHDDDADAAERRRRDEAASAQCFVIGVRGQHDQHVDVDVDIQIKRARRRPGTRTLPLRLGCARLAMVERDAHVVRGDASDCVNARPSRARSRSA